ncbi:Sec24B protein [Culex quinquefasciatus]|uniref:Sec24B protein n=1 Tax=Culex quinquefasciatus TaxID=7176 RepID=B0X7I1_CULQU|nr:Sec24B protein [Culex quinquefasciatus]|eukprot:XP_001865603.1 Sec24B protein [Culex quinquefasciatus]
MACGHALFDSGNKQESAVVRWRVCEERGRTSAPLVTTKFITQDQNQGSSGQCFMRSSMSHFPVNTDMIKQSTVLFELIVSPFVRAGEKELVHPIVQLASWDRFDARPICVRESSSSTADVVPVPGTYDFVITKDYCRNNTPPKVLAMVFVIDVSYNKVKSGLVHLLCAEFKNNIRHLPVDEGQERASIKVHEASSLTAPDGGRRRCPVCCSHPARATQVLTLVPDFYPWLTPVHDVNVDVSNVPAAIRCTADKMMEIISIQVGYNPRF